MNPKEGHNPKKNTSQHDASMLEAHFDTDKNKTINPPGVTIPPETEMSPPQLG